MHIISHLFPFNVQFKDTNLSKPHDKIYSEPPQNNEVAKAYWFKFISSDKSQPFSSLHFLHVDLAQSDRIGS